MIGVKERREIKACFFDLDDTLYDQLVPFKNAAKSIGILNDINYGKLFKTVRHYSDTLWKEAYCTGEMSLQELRVQRLVRAFHDFDIKLSEDNAEKLQQIYLDYQQRIIPFAGVVSLMKSLQQEGYLVGILSNGPVDHQLSKLKTLHIVDIIPEDFIFVSDGVGIAKPDKGIFIYVQEKLGLSPENCFYVGDSWVNDVIPSHHAGWNSVWFNFRKRKPLSDFNGYREIRNYIEVNGFETFQ
ncbi:MULTISPECIES: HAD family hydrolase [Bacillaceae]|uniref:HAD family hydrolase n=1 Tax=Evansella alkalicola TaxID=745819 RepID=A0ABS6JR43_9BACI|nr:MULTISPECIES: HAD family hydrolase [Bacillaceae]MBU9721010.1 HAD family hydrolase [Bacillus alkalicola]